MVVILASIIKSVKGMHDTLPLDTLKIRAVEAKLMALASRFGYKEIRTPLVEQMSLFKRSAGDDSDVVNKEMYTFTDQNNDILALRPEGTAACVRAGIQHGLFYGQKQRLCYLGSMFRRERPQKGRYRQFNQYGLEAIGFADSYIEIEIIALVNAIFEGFGIQPVLELNHLGSAESRAVFTKDLTQYLLKFESELDPDSSRRLVNNPLRIFDSKDPNTQKILEHAPKVHEYLSAKEQKQLEFISQNLTKLGIDYTIQPSMVRGLDYYTGMVFEWQYKGLTLCAGGRYDNLVADLGGADCPAVGIAMGVERLIEASELSEQLEPSVSVLCNHLPAYTTAMKLANIIREHNISATCEYNETKLKPLLKLANQIKSSYVILLGEQEFACDNIVAKNMLTAETFEFASIELFIEHLERQNV